MCASSIHAPRRRSSCRRLPEQGGAGTLGGAEAFSLAPPPGPDRRRSPRLAEHGRMRALPPPSTSAISATSSDELELEVFSKMFYGRPPWLSTEADAATTPLPKLPPALWTPFRHSNPPKTIAASGLAEGLGSERRKAEGSRRVGAWRLGPPIDVGRAPPQAARSFERAQGSGPSACWPAVVAWSLPPRSRSGLAVARARFASLRRLPPESRLSSGLTGRTRRLGHSQLLRASPGQFRPPRLLSPPHSPT